MNAGMARYLDGVFEKRDEKVGGESSLVARESGQATENTGVASECTTAGYNEDIAGDDVEDNIEGNYEKELSEISKKSVEFAIQFSPSRQVKKHIKEHVEPSFITAKMQKPKIESIEKVCVGTSKNAPSVIKIKGDGLKVVGKGASLCIKTRDGLIKISKEAVLQNEPKTLMVLVNKPLKDGEKYTLKISTRYAKMGNRQTSLVRRCVKDFSFERMKKRKKAS